MTDFSKLKELAEGCRDQVIRSHGWEGMIEDADLLGRDEKFLKECSPEKVLALIAENERLNSENKQLVLLECQGGTAEAAINLLAENEALKEKYEAARDRKNSITALQVENETLRDAAAVSAMRIKELDLLFGRYILAMRAAVIEDEHGKTETTGMDWIFNSLVGPGQLPPEDETDAQAYFDREIVAVDNSMQEVLAFHDARRAATGKGEQS